jgi:peptidoglycan hydrolase-like protein with peptidoglycan-binding domain
MDSKKKNIIIIVVVVLCLGIIGFVIYYFRDKLFSKPSPAPEADTDESGKKITWQLDGFPLKLGSSGERVKHVQAGLNMLKEENLALDGKFGLKTEAAVFEHFKVKQISESAYNTFVKPNLEKIIQYITGKKGNAAPGGISLIGKTVFAKNDCTGFVALKKSNIWTIQEDQPIQYTAGAFIGVVEQDNNGWLVAFRTNGSRVFVEKKNAKTGF